MPHPLLEVREGSRYCLAEEIASSITHGVGALMALIGGIVMIVMAAMTGDLWKIVSVSIYGAAAVLLFTMSTLYHALTHPRAKAIFRIFDHSTIFLLIAGTYTPFTLVTLRGPGGWTLFALVWGLAAMGIVLNAIDLERFKKLSLISYIAAGWMVVFSFKSLWLNLPWPGPLLLIAGGLMYTGGIFFYARKKTRFTHAIWHLFVLAGAAFHYFSILYYVV